MHAADTTDITVSRGDAVILPLTLKTGVYEVNSTGTTRTETAADLSGGVVYFTISQTAATTTGNVDAMRKQSPEPYVDTSGIVITSPTDGRATVSISTGDAWTLSSGPYYYGIQLKITGAIQPQSSGLSGAAPSGAIYTCVTGVFNVQPNISRRIF